MYPNSFNAAAATQCLTFSWCPDHFLREWGDLTLTITITIKCLETALPIRRCVLGAADPYKFEQHSKGLAWHHIYKALRRPYNHLCLYFFKYLYPSRYNFDFRLYLRHKKSSQGSIDYESQPFPHFALYSCRHVRLRRLDSAIRGWYLWTSLPPSRSNWTPPNSHQARNPAVHHPGSAPTISTVQSGAWWLPRVV